MNNFSFKITLKINSLDDPLNNYIITVEERLEAPSCGGKSNKTSLLNYALLGRTGVTLFFRPFWSQFELQRSEYFVIYSRYASMCSPIRWSNKKAY